MKQKVMMPSYIEDFQCIASECEETCCAGWYIAIDEKTYKKYKKVKQPAMKKRLDKELVVRKGGTAECMAKIKLKNNRCAFLGKDNLCDVYRELGEDYLSETCKVYPRNLNQLGEQVEISLALSCPEAARKILLSKEAIGFKESILEEQLPIVGATVALKAEHPKHFEDCLLAMRKLLIGILQEKALSFDLRWQGLENALQTMQQFKQKQDIKGLKKWLDMQTDYKKLCIVKDKPKTMAEELKYMQKLMTCLIDLRSAKKWPSARYETCYEQMLQGLLVDAKQGIISAEKYGAGKNVYEGSFLQNAPYILENYFVNYVYERLVPINEASPKESLETLKLYYALLRLHLIGLFESLGDYEESAVLTCIQSFTRVFDHNPLYMEQIKKQLK